MGALFAKIRAEIGFIVLVAVAVAGAWMYVEWRTTRADRNALLQSAELLCTAAGAEFAGTQGLKRGVACKARIAALADFKARTDQITAKTLADALAAHDARQLTDNLAAREAAEAARDAAHRMEIADAEAERRNLVDRDWTAAVNHVAGLRSATAR